MLETSKKSVKAIDGGVSLSEKREIRTFLKVTSSLEKDKHRIHYNASVALMLATVMFICHLVWFQIGNVRITHGRSEGDCP